MSKFCNAALGCPYGSANPHCVFPHCPRGASENAITRRAPSTPTTATTINSIATDSTLIATPTHGGVGEPLDLAIARQYVELTGRKEGGTASLLARIDSLTARLADAERGRDEADAYWWDEKLLRARVATQLAGVAMIASDKRAGESAVAAVRRVVEERDALKARLGRIDDHAPERCESLSEHCGPVEYSDVEGVPLCANCWADLREIDPCPKGDPECMTGDDGSCHDACEAPDAATGAT
ncbi:MAG TPA: hypothetical protein VE869_16000 [Gemmatimonas sp.]|nr:hypothetical protein [Gemmatimonas sp.]